MKQNAFLWAAVALTGLLVCCNRQENDKRLVDNGNRIMEVTANVPSYDDAEAVKSQLSSNGDFSWSTNDKIGFVPDASIAPVGQPVQQMFYIENGSTGRFRANGWGLLPGARYYTYYPYNSANAGHAVTVSYDGQRQTANSSTAHLGGYDYLHAWTDVPDASEPAIEYRHLGSVARFVITIPQEYRTARFTKLTLSVPNDVIMNSGTYNPAATYPTATSGKGETVAFNTRSMSGTFSVDLGSGSGITCNADNQLEIFAMMCQTAWSGKTVSFILDAVDGGSGDDLAFYGSFTPGKNQVAGARYRYAATASCSAVRDLSASESANCYVVTSPGEYRFRADVKGNGVSVGNAPTNIASPVCAYLLWESVNTTTAPARNSLITNVTYADGYISFETPATLTAGNAVIALLSVTPDDYYSSNGNTLWSWHIWISPEAPGDDQYAASMTFMDRNLGALSKERNNPLSMGLLYQWGRPQPMLGAAAFSNTAAVARFQATSGHPSSVTVPAVVDGTGPHTTETCIGFPLQFFVGVNGNRHWSSQNALTLWGTSKTMYDPCPPGYKVPDRFDGLQLSQTFDQYGAMVRYGSNGTAYYWPLTGMRGLNFTSSLTNVAHDATYWGGAADNPSAVLTTVGYGMNFNLDAPNSLNIGDASQSYAITGNAVRCMKIQ